MYKNNVIISHDSLLRYYEMSAMMLKLWPYISDLYHVTFECQIIIYYTCTCMYRYMHHRGRECHLL